MTWPEFPSFPSHCPETEPELTGGRYLFSLNTRLLFSLSCLCCLPRAPRRNPDSSLHPSRLHATCTLLTSPPPSKPCPQQSEQFPTSGPLHSLFLPPGRLCPIPSRACILFTPQLTRRSLETPLHLSFKNIPLSSLFPFASTLHLLHRNCCNLN